METASVARVPVRRASPSRAMLTAIVSVLLSSLVFAAQSQEIVRRDTIDPGLGPLPSDVARSSPAATWRSFLALAGAGRYDLASHAIDLVGTAPGQQPKVGADVAEKLYRILSLLKAREDAVTTEDESGPAIDGRPTNEVVALRFERSGISGEVRLRHTLGASPYQLAWLFARETVASVPFWYRVLVKGEAARGAEPLDVGLGTIPDEVNRATPREAMAGFLAACQEGRFDLASFYMDLGAVPPERQPAEGRRLARRLMLTLQRTGWVDPEKLSNEPLGRPETGVPENQQLFAVVHVRHQPIEFFLSHRADAELGNVWTISQETVAEIDRLYDAHGYGWFGDRAPVALFAFRVADLQLWQWLGLLVGLVGSWFASRILGRWLVILVGWFSRRAAPVWQEAVIRPLDGPIAFLLASVILALLARWVGVTPDAWIVTRYVCRLLALVGVGWFLVRLVDAAAVRVREAAVASGGVGLGFLPMTVRVVKAVVVIMIGLAVLDVIGLNVVAGLGALGIGAAAIAFAAQKTLENMFGTASIASDRPFEVGDYVTIGQDSGTVEEVGFRSTRVRTLGRTLVTVPNGLVASGRVENFSARDRIMYNPVLRLSYASNAAQLRTVIGGLGNLLRSHPKVFQGEQRVRLAGFSEGAFNIEVWCWVATKSYVEYTAVVEELNFAILGIVEGAGTSFAIPSGTVYLARAGIAAGTRGAGAGRESGAPGEPAAPEGPGAASPEGGGR